MPSGVYKRTEFHKKILAGNSLFKKGNNLRAGLPSTFLGRHHTSNAKKIIGQKSKKMWKNPAIRKTISSKLSERMTGLFSEKSIGWGGGVHINSNGYRIIYSPSHPNASKTKYVLEHRLVVEKIIGRYLHPSESVHHVNENRKDNRIKNLVLFKNRSVHLSFHYGKIPKDGDIVFDGRFHK